MSKNRRTAVMSQTTPSSAAVTEQTPSQPQEQSETMLHFDPEPTDLLEAVKQLKASSDAQVDQLRQQLRYTKWGMYCLAGLLAVATAAALVILPPAGRAITQAEQAVIQAEQTLSQLQPAVESLAKADIAGTLKNANELITESREGLAEGLERLEQAQAKIQAFDVETLNKAIKELDNLVRPLGKLFGR